MDEYSAVIGIGKPADKKKAQMDVLAERARNGTFMSQSDADAADEKSLTQLRKATAVINGPKEPTKPVDPHGE